MIGFIALLTGFIAKPGDFLPIIELHGQVCSLEVITPGMVEFIAEYLAWRIAFLRWLRQYPVQIGDRQHTKSEIWKVA